MVRLAFATLAFAVSACATGKGEAGPVPPVVRPKLNAPILAGKRCHNGECTCRAANDRREDPPPAEGQKRIEIRMSVNNGKATLDSPTIGHFEHSGPEDACFYVDLPAGPVHDFHFDSQESSPDTGLTPHVHISEYGPAGPYWYDILDIECGEGARGCDTVLAREWGQAWLTHRKRGRLDACGSIVVTGLKWYTSGGVAAQNGGVLRDFLTDFSLEAKKFATEFPPGAAECKIGH
jgi:hypothetical protein